MDHNGISFGSHTVTHPQLRELKPSAIRDEVGDSKETIENKLGHEVDSFAYPYAFPQTDSDFKSTLGEFLKEAGYRTGVCTVVGRANRASDPFFLERLPINSWDDDALFQAKLMGAYDWISTTQHIFKMVKAMVRGSLIPCKHNVSKEFPEVQRP